MITQERPNPRSKYFFDILNVGECKTLDDMLYTAEDLQRARSAAYRYRKTNGMELEFKVELQDNKLKIFRTK